jgi:hypothetical protein
MTSPILLPTLSSAERAQVAAVHAVRTRALERLYERRAAVDNLIRSLEDYASNSVRRRQCLEFSAARKCS